MSETEANQLVADEIRRNFEWKGMRFAIGDCIALLDGEIIATTKNLDDALMALRSRAPLPKRGMLVEVRPPVLDVIR